MSKQEARAQQVSEWLEHLRRWQTTSGSLAAYAKEHGLALWALYHWRNVLVREGRWQPTQRASKAKPVSARKAATPPHFARVTLSEALTAPYIVRLQLGNGRRAEIEVWQMDPLLQLIAGLERQP